MRRTEAMVRRHVNPRELEIMTRMISRPPLALIGGRARKAGLRTGGSTRAVAVLGPRTILVVSVWIGLVTAAIECFIFWFRWRFVDRTALSSLQLNQHAGWMVPLSDALIFATAGLAAAVVVRLGRSRWAAALAVYGLCFLSAYGLLLSYRGLSSLACAALAGGLSFRISAVILRRSDGFRRVVLASTPVLAGVVGILWLLGPVGEEISELEIPPARPGSPNVLLIVLDTVRAESLSLHGHARRTSPFLEQLARRGIRFDQARATAPWTLPSHASFFTGRWPHELSTRLDNPLDDRYSTIAEYLRDRGYDTAGFVANTFFCSRWFGLARGFIHYQDVAIDPVEILRSSGLGRALWRKLGPVTDDRPTAYFRRRNAAQINTEFLAWLSSRPSGRPFFAFLNYYDAHDPYVSPEDEASPSAARARSARELELLRDWHRRGQTAVAEHGVELGRDAYADCIGYLDRQLARLFESLEARGLLKETLVVLTSDHGEEFNEHGVLGHGQNLYSQVLHVPLLVIGPDLPAGRTVAEPVTLRDLPATLVDLLGLADRSSFPGRSMAPHWADSTPTAAIAGDPVMSEINDDDGKFREGPPARAIVERDRVYIRSEDGREELYDLVHDPAETRDLRGEPSEQPALNRLRRVADGFPGISAGPARSGANLLE
jgi:arylsulfatase A-like enzyme